MNFVERVMRVMTHVNIGAALGMLAWVVWSGWQVVTGQIGPASGLPPTSALAGLAHRGAAAPMHLSPVVAGRILPSCHDGAAAVRPGAAGLSGDDL